MTFVISAATVTFADLVFPVGTGHLAVKCRHLLGLIQASIVSDCVCVWFCICLGSLDPMILQGAALELNENRRVKNLCQEKQFHGIVRGWGLFFFSVFCGKGHSTKQKLCPL